MRGYVHEELLAAALDDGARRRTGCRGCEDAATDHRAELHSISGHFDGTAAVSFTTRFCDATKGRFRIYLTQQRLLNGSWQTRRSSFPLIWHYGGCFSYGFDRPAARNPTTARMDAFRIKVQVRDTLGALSKPRTAEIVSDD